MATFDDFPQHVFGEHGAALGFVAFEFLETLIFFCVGEAVFWVGDAGFEFGWLSDHKWKIVMYSDYKLKLIIIDLVCFLVSRRASDRSISTRQFLASTAKVQSQVPAYQSCL